VIYFPDSRFARDHGAVPAPSVTPLHPERRKGANADPSNVTVICSRADRLVRDMGCEPDKPA
jgi:hypothetical protein